MSGRARSPIPDLGNALFTVVADTCGGHDTIYGCCSQANNFLRYGVPGTHSCFANFVEILGRFGLDRSAIVGNVNFLMTVSPPTVRPSMSIAIRKQEITLTCAPSATYWWCCRTVQMHNPAIHWGITVVEVEQAERPIMGRQRTFAMASGGAPAVSPACEISARRYRLVEPQNASGCRGYPRERAGNRRVRSI